MSSEHPHTYRASDEVEIIKFREGVIARMTAFETKSQGILDGIERIWTSFGEFKNGQGNRMDEQQKKLEDHQDRLARIETSLAMLVKITWAIVTCSIGVIGAAFYKLIIK